MCCRRRRDDITAFTFNTGSLSVTNGAFYVAFLSASDLGGWG